MASAAHHPQKPQSKSSYTSDSAPLWMRINGVQVLPYRKPEATSVRVAYDTAHAKADGPKAPITFDHRREPHRQILDRSRKEVRTADGKYHKKLIQASMVSAEAPDYFRVGGKAQLLMIPTPQPPPSIGVHIPSLRPYSNLQKKRRSSVPRQNGSVSYDTPPWFKIPGIRDFFFIQPLYLPVLILHH